MYGDANLILPYKVKGHPRTIIKKINLVDLESMVLYSKDQHQNFVGSGEEDF